MDDKAANNERLFRDQPVWKAIAALAVPSLLSVAFGAGETDKAKNTASLCFYSGVVLSVLLTVLLLCFSAPLLRFLGTQPEMWEDAETYLRILALGGFAK